MTNAYWIMYSLLAGGLGGLLVQIRNISRRLSEVETWLAKLDPDFSNKDEMLDEE
jgi:hypothetical protein